MRKIQARWHFARHSLVANAEQTHICSAREVKCEALTQKVMSITSRVFFFFVTSESCCDVSTAQHLSPCIWSRKITLASFATKNRFLRGHLHTEVRAFPSSND